MITTAQAVSNLKCHFVNSMVNLVYEDLYGFKCEDVDYALIKKYISLLENDGTCDLTQTLKCTILDNANIPFDACDSKEVTFQCNITITQENPSCNSNITITQIT